MSVTITKTFASDAEAAAWLADHPSQPAAGPAAAPKPAAPAASAPTAASASPAAAPAQTAASSATQLNFEKDVIEPMKAHFKKLNREQCVAFLKGFGVEKPADLKDKPDQWQKAIDAMKA